MSTPPNRRVRVIPGFGLTLGLTLTYLSLMVLIPLATLPLRAASLTWDGFWGTVLSERALAAYRLSVGGALVAAGINSVFGVIVAWVLVRYDFPGKRLVDGLIDLPFALPTAVAGIALTAIYSPHGWLGAPLERLGIKAAYSELGVIIAMTFVGLPFVVRAVQPVLQSMERDIEEAAMILGSRRWQVGWHVILPGVTPGVLVGLSMAFARAVGEYGSVIFIAGNVPGRTEIAPLLIYTRLEEFAYGEAAAIGGVMLALSFVMLLVINALQSWCLLRSGS